MAAIMASMHVKTRIAPLAGGLFRVFSLSCLAGALIVGPSLAAQRTERPMLTVSGYVINAEIDATAHHLTANVVVSFIAPENTEAASFALHPALKVTTISDETGKVLTGQRSPDGGIRIAPATPFVNGQTAHWTFEYEGILTGNDDSDRGDQRLMTVETTASVCASTGSRC